MSQIIDATPYELWVADGIEAQYAREMDYLNASHMATGTSLTPGLVAPDESASSMADGCKPNKWGVV